MQSYDDVIYRWWREVASLGMGVAASFFLHSSNKGLWACLGDLHSGMPGGPEARYYLLERGSIILGSVGLFQGYHSQHQNLHCWQRLHWYGSCISTAVKRRSQGPWPNTWRLQLPLDDFCRLVIPYDAIKHATDGTDPCDPPRMGAKITTTSKHLEWE